MYRDVALVRIAGQLRRAREVMSDAEAQLVDIGLHQIAFELQDLSLELEELHLDLMQPLSQLPPAAPRPPAPRRPDELPF